VRFPQAVYIASCLTKFQYMITDARTNSLITEAFRHRSNGFRSKTRTNMSRIVCCAVFIGQNCC